MIKMIRPTLLINEIKAVFKMIVAVIVGLFIVISIMAHGGGSNAKMANQIRSTNTRGTSTTKCQWCLTKYPG